MLAFAVSPEDLGNKPPIDSSGGSQTPPSDENGGVEKPDDPPDDQPIYTIEFDTLGSGSVENIDVECVKEAKGGERVDFTVFLVDLSAVYDDYVPLKITRIVFDNGENEIEIGSGEGSFSFIMPSHDARIMIYLMPDTEKQYTISPDCLGNASMKAFKFECVGKAKFNEEVTFTVTLLDKSKEITGIVLTHGNTGEELRTIGHGEGSFKFTMPGHDVVIMFYILNAGD